MDITNALDKAFAVHVGRLYSQLLGAVVAAGGDEEGKTEGVRVYR
jgi:hypothetical protein